ncbi:snRNA-activating protein complex subunit 4 [Pieris rapae]|uniref:snRNA-activating protein complex subunit 4 n=1 Tax=Pieris rapae TaxID=64459 RepID=UPI001E28129F|nr:snRNA-activating protein complex subunit 4 [Pieris rapae]
MSDTDSDIESDEEAELEDLRKLNAALADDDAGPSRATSQYSFNTKVSISDSLFDDISEIDTTIALNKLYDQKLQILEIKLHNRLRECRERLQAVQNMVIKEKLPVTSFHHITCGKPYFKDRNGFSPPENKDSFLKKQADFLDYSTVQLGIGWTLGNKDFFLKVMHSVSEKIKKEEIKAKLNDLCRKAKTNKSFKGQITKLNTEMGELKNKSLKDLALPIDEEYDWNYVASLLNLRHKPHEYRAMWKLFLHPVINKNVWSETEAKRLLGIAQKFNYQGWDTIAKELNNGRTQFQCFISFRSNTLKSQVTRKWTREEEEYLKRLVDYFKIGNCIPWAKVAASMENRTKVQVYHKYLRLTQERKGRFLPEEDAIILTFIEKYGPDFKRMTWYLPGRTMSQCRVRYEVLSQRRMSVVWTVEEDIKLMQLAANQDPPRNFSKIAEYFPHKNRKIVRSRYLVLEKWMARHPNVNIVNAPRRASREIKRGSSSDSLNKAIDNLKKRLEQELNDKKYKVVNQDSSEDKIEDEIISFLVKEQIKLDEQQKYKAIPQANDQETTDNSDQESETLPEEHGGTNIKLVKQILILLRAKLNKSKFLQSSISEEYPGLLEDDHLNIYGTVNKSYSRKVSNTTSTIKCPDIWGSNTLGPNQFLLPPNYATITGCRKLMNSVKESQLSNAVQNIQEYMRRNTIFKESMQLLNTRFYTLFLWPMILSTHKPPEKFFLKETNEPHEKEAFPPVVFKEEDYNFNQDKNQVAMHRVKGNDLADNVIDLPNNNDHDEITLMELHNFEEDEGCILGLE